MSETTNDKKPQEPTEDSGACPGGVPALWFDRAGCGPDQFFLQLHPFAAEMNGAIPASLGIRVRSGGLVINAAKMVDGGFNMDRASVAELHRKIGEWLAVTP